HVSRHMLSSCRDTCSAHVATAGVLSDATAATWLDVSEPFEMPLNRAQREPVDLALHVLRGRAIAVLEVIALGEQMQQASNALVAFVRFRLPLAGSRVPAALRAGLGTRDEPRVGGGIARARPSEQRRERRRHGIVCRDGSPHGIQAVECPERFEGSLAITS